MKKLRVVGPKVFMLVVAILYVAYSEIRISNLQSISDLVYDGSSCYEPGFDIKDVKSCFISRGYLVRNFDVGQIIVVPELSASDLMFRRFGFLIKYDKKGKVSDGKLSSGIAAF